MLIRRWRLPLQRCTLPSRTVEAAAEKRFALRDQSSRWFTKAKNASQTKSHQHTSQPSQHAIARRAAYDAVDRALLRSLLRESGYFPDEVVQDYVRQQAIKRFRTYEARSSKTAFDSEYCTRLEHVRKKARQSLHLLQRANIGDMRAFRAVLLKSYGLHGEYRRRLMDDFMRPGLCSTATAQNSQTSENEAPRTRRVKEEAAKTTPALSESWKQFAPPMPPQLKALSASQLRAGIHFGAVTRLKAPAPLHPRIPAVNAWHRPMPLLRVKNMTAAWWADLLARLIPPLPLEQWFRLYALATGKITADGAARRRGGSALSPPVAMEYVAMGKTNRRVRMEHRKRKINERAARRAWADVFRMSALFEYDQGYKITWGKQVMSDPTMAAKIEERYHERQSSMIK